MHEYFDAKFNGLLVIPWLGQGNKMPLIHIWNCQRNSRSI